MSSLNVLNMASQGLQLQQQAAGAHQHNISNAQTPGAHRVDLRISAGSLAQPAHSQWVRAEDVLGQRAVDDKGADLAFAREQGRLLRMQLGERLGQLGQEDDLPRSLSRFFASWRDLQRQPADLALRQNVLICSQQVADEVQASRAACQQQRRQLDDEVVRRVADANVALNNIADLGRQLLILGADAPRAHALADRRDQALTELCASLGATTRADGHGLPQAVLGGDMSLGHGGHAHLLALRLDATTAMHHVVVEETLDLSLDARITSGQLGAQLQVRDQALPGAIAQLDQFAFDLATAANGQHQAGFGLDGVNNRPLFVAPPALPAGYAATIALDASVLGQPQRLAAAGLAANLPSEADNALAITALDRAQVALGNSTTLGGALTQLAADVGHQLGRADASAQQLAYDHEALVAGLQRTVGINIEQQLAMAQQAQVAYQANSRMQQILQQMLPVTLAR